MSETAQPSDAKTRRRLTTVLAADICGYSRLAEVDEDAALKTVRIVSTLFDNAVEAHHGRVFKRAGDGFFAEFPSASDGVCAAIAFINDIRSRDTISPSSPNAKVRAGVHVGEVADIEDGDLLGHGVNIAARLQAETEPNGILVSLHAVNLVRDKINAQFRRRGPLVLKNIKEPVIAFDVERVSSNFLLDSSKFVSRIVRRHWQFVTGLAAVMLALVILIDGQGSKNAADVVAPSKSPEEIRAEIALSRIKPKSETDKRQLKAILMDLVRSNEQFDQNVFSLIENGDLSAAYDLLLARAHAFRVDNDIEKSVAEYRKAAAVVFDDDIEAAKVALERIIDLDPDDFLAHALLGRLNYTQSQTSRSNWHFDRALAIGTDNVDDEVFTKIQYATSKIVQERYAEADAMLEGAAAKATAHGFDSLTSQAKSRIAYSQMKQMDFEAARRTLDEVMPVQIARGFDAQYAVSLWLRGRMSQSDGDFEGAKSSFEKAFEIEQATGRALGMADTSFYIGLNSVRLNDLTSAVASFERGLDIARANNMINMQIKNLVGIALAEKNAGENGKACRTLSRAAVIHTDDIVYNPWTREIISSLGCAYPPLNLSATAL